MSQDYYQEYEVTLTVTHTYKYIMNHEKGKNPQEQAMHDWLNHSYLFDCTNQKIEITTDKYGV